ncbi:hypothetical protein EYF80_008323 [Liparis tanakae]|uniref:Uncharacterized protein n=1 Tax=Liparis tanakae TaxID=230148 RepID=A0A4Z2IU86_9TELE|nr:hypothetical protein EYF80_008323 [Liparis tanakae]
MQKDYFGLFSAPLAEAEELVNGAASFSEKLVATGLQLPVALEQAGIRPPHVAFQSLQVRERTVTQREVCAALTPAVAAVADKLALGFTADIVESRLDEAALQVARIDRFSVKDPQAILYLVLKPCWYLSAASVNSRAWWKGPLSDSSQSREPGAPSSCPAADAAPPAPEVQQQQSQRPNAAPTHSRDRRL